MLMSVEFRNIKIHIFLTELIISSHRTRQSGKSNFSCILTDVTGKNTFVFCVAEVAFPFTRIRRPPLNLRLRDARVV